MIQRIQSIYLLLAAIAMAAFAFAPVAVSSIDGSVLISALLSGETGMFYSLAALICLITVLSIVTIFKFRNLKLQQKLCKMNVLFTLILLVSIGIAIFQLPAELSARPTWWNLLPFLTLCLLSLAYRGVAHDRKLLSDSSRLR